MQRETGDGQELKGSMPEMCRKRENVKDGKKKHVCATVLEFPGSVP
jgi:hypothetical protein